MPDPDHSDTTKTPQEAVTRRLRARADAAMTRATWMLAVLLTIGLLGTAAIILEMVGVFVSVSVEETAARDAVQTQAEERLTALRGDLARLDADRDALRNRIADELKGAWVRRETPTGEDLYSVQFIDQAVGWAVGAGGTILATTDGGQTWAAQKSPTGGNLLSVQFLDQAVGWAVGASGTILATTDGGRIWQRRISPTVNSLTSVQLVGQTNGWIVGSNGTILATTDGGRNWRTQNAPTRDNLWSVQFVDQAVGWAVDTSGTILATSDGGQTWQAQTSPTGVDLRSVQFVDRAVGWAVGDSGTILATSEGGRTWQAQKSPTGESLWSVQFVDQAVGWAVGSSGIILATTDGGQTWAAQKSPTGEDLAAVQFVDQAVGWAVGANGTVLATSDELSAQVRPAADAEALRVAVAGLPDHTDRTVWLGDLQGLVNRRQDTLARIATTTAEIAAARSGELSRRQELDLMDGFLTTCINAEGARDKDLVAACTGAFNAAVAKDATANWYRYLANRITPAALLLFLMFTLGAGHRYNMRIAGFYHARADALELMGEGRSALTFDALAQTLAAEKVEFKAGKTPADQVTELTKAAIQRTS